MILLIYSGINVIPELGIGAAAIASGVIACTVDPGHPAGLEQIIKSGLRANSSLCLSTQRTTTG